MKISALPGMLGLLGVLMKYNHCAKEIDGAKASGDIELEKQKIAVHAAEWADAEIRKAGASLLVEGRENIPAQDGFVVIANHQGYGDILALLSAFRGHQLGFVAKEELGRVPLLGPWILRVRSVLIQRGDARAALRSLSEGTKMVKQGFNLCIFPEGTRAKGPHPGPFKPGSFKLATKAKAPVVPVSIQGTYHIYEEKGRIRPGTVRIRIHPALPTDGLSRQEQNELESRVESIVKEGQSALYEAEQSSGR